MFKISHESCLKNTRIDIFCQSQSVALANGATKGSGGLERPRPHDNGGFVGIGLRDLHHRYYHDKYRLHYDAIAPSEHW